jgi:hypothetical protein
MKRTISKENVVAPIESRRPSSAEDPDGLLGERELREIEKSWPNGMTSRQIVDVFEARGIRFSEATLRKYVQLGLLPRSVRVGRKGKHKGSCGLYPANVVRRINAVKGMMAENHTIEEIRRSFAKFKDDIDNVEKELRDLLASFEREAKDSGGPQDPDRRRALEAELVEARKMATDLVRRISRLERRISETAADESARDAAVGSGSDLF